VAAGQHDSMILLLFSFLNLFSLQWLQMSLTWMTTDFMFQNGLPVELVTVGKNYPTGNSKLVYIETSALDTTTVPTLRLWQAAFLRSLSFSGQIFEKWIRSLSFRTKSWQRQFG
jgi:hypothetical protein